MAVYTKLSEDQLNEFFLKYNLGELLIKNSVDKNKLEKLYTNSLNQAKASLKHIKA